MTGIRNRSHLRRSASGPVREVGELDSRIGARLLRFFSRQRLIELDPADFDPSLRARLLVLQPTPFCNVDCTYCYLPDRTNRARMAPATAATAARRLLDDGLLGDSLTVVWHAGEPLVLPVGYYEEAFAAIAEAASSTCRVSHSIQTNATLIDDAWCDLFRKHRVNVGVSVDGPAALHDRHRRTRGGRGTHEAAMAGLAALRRHGIPHHAIAVVTAESLRQVDEIYRFFRDQRIGDVGFNYDEAEGPHAISSIAAREQEHRVFVERMLDHVIESRWTFQVRELAHAFRLVAEGVPRYRWRGTILPDNGQTVPFALVNVAWNGDFSTFSPELLGQQNRTYSNFVLGNVHACGYLEAARGEAFMRLWNAVLLGTRACEAACPYFDYCGGGAPANKLYENGRIESAETLYCRSMIQRPFEAVLSAVETRGTDSRAPGSPRTGPDESHNHDDREARQGTCPNP